MYTPTILSEGYLHHVGEKQAINYPIQGGLMEVVKDAMLRSSEYLIFNVHDELLYLVPDSEVKEYTLHLSEQLPDNGYDVPFPWDIKVGKNWGTIKNLPFTLDLEE